MGENSGFSEAEAFLRRRLGKGSGRGYRSVVRGEGVPQGETVRPVPKGRWDSVVRLEGAEESAEPAPRAMAHEAPAAAMALPAAWWGFLGRPWSGAWRWVLGIGAAACAALGLATSAAPEAHGLYAVAMAGCVPVAMVTLFCELEASRRVGAWVAAAVFVAGGALSIGLTFLLNALTGIDSPFLAGVTEEPAKGAVLLALAFVPRFRGILCGLALSVCVGAGFATIETVGYAYSFGEGGLPSTGVLLLRGVLSPFTHMGWTGALGGAMWAARSAPSQTWVAAAVLLGMVAAHCLWNTLGPLTYLSLALWALIFHYVRRGAEEAASPKGV